MSANTRQLYLARKSSVAPPAAVEATLDLGEWPLPHVEVYVKSDAAVTFTVYGSATGLVGEWRKVGVISVLAPDFEDHAGYSNAYRHIKVECLAAGDHFVEIVGGR